jgi:hypothetical protein
MRPIGRRRRRSRWTLQAPPRILAHRQWSKPPRYRRGESGGSALHGSDSEAQPDAGEDAHAQRFSHYEEAAKLAMVAHPLPGEDLETRYLEDAQMWVDVYTELLEFKETLLRDTAHALDTISAAGREEVTRTDAVILDAEAQRFRQRLMMWRQRCAELASAT